MRKALRASKAERSAKRLSAPVLPLCTTIFLLACASGKYQVPDADFFTDGYPLDKQTVQIVESHEDKSLMLPAAERHARNCEAAEAKARKRHRAAYPHSRDQGKRLSARFDKNAGCTVRMAFRSE
jgi:hypothetical protein